MSAIVPPHVHEPHLHIPHDRARRVDIAVACLLGIAALTSGLTSWRSAIHSGHAQAQFALSTQAVSNANALQQNAEAAASAERTLYVAWIGALARGNRGGVEAIWGLMNQATRETIDWWRRQPPAARPASPFSSANPDWTTPRRVIEARVALNRSSAQLAGADSQLNQSHTLELIVALISLTFLTGGLAATISSPVAQPVLFSVATALLLVSFLGLVLLW